MLDQELMDEIEPTLPEGIPHVFYYINFGCTKTQLKAANIPTTGSANLHFPHRHRTQPDRFPNATRSDGGRNPIGGRTEHDDFYGAFSTRKPHSLLTLAKHVRNQT
ncbi:hypothetical protein, partial [Leyella stercorea]|uniref:hypothetical protein n=1 Tax=Leyella stercorea TaxID=363265 RepID=UPI003A8DD238